MPTTIPTTTSTNRPSASAGDAYFETDTKSYIIYDGADWRVYNYDETTAFSNTLSLSFDGNDDLITNFQAPATTTYSVSMWLKSTNTTSNFAFVDDGPTGGGAGSFQVISPSSTKSFYILFKNGSTTNAKNGVGGTNATLDIRDGLWHHLAVTINGTSLKIYKDGGDAAINSGSPSNNQGTPFVSETTTTSNSWSSNVGMAGNSGTNYVIGSQGYTGTTYHFNGVLDEVAFFTTELSGSDVSSIYNSGVPNDVGTQGLNLSPSAYFRMGDGLSDTDSSGNAASNSQSVGTVTSLVGGYTGTQSTASRKPTYSSDTPS